MFWHKWTEGTIYDNMNGPGGLFMSNISCPPRTTYARTIYVVTVQNTQGKMYDYLVGVSSVIDSASSYTPCTVYLVEM